METASVKTLNNLKSSEELAALNKMNIHSVRDLAEFTPCRYAEILITALQNGNLTNLALKEYLDNQYLDSTDFEASKLPKASIIHVEGIGSAYEKIFNDAFNIKTIEKLATFPAYLEARQLIQKRLEDHFYEKPSAPKELLPEMIGSTHTQVRFSNFVKEKDHELEYASLTGISNIDEPSPALELLQAFERGVFKFQLGYLALIKQKWVNLGTHLGEVLHSLALAPGESRNIAFIEWYKRQKSQRSEDTDVAESLSSEFTQTRALSEVVQSTATEHLSGETEIDATTRTTGAGVTGGAGGGLSVGASGKANLESLGYPAEVAGGALGSAAGSLGTSVVFSKGKVQGTLKSETSGERSVTAELVQNIADSTIQNSSSIRSLMSTVVLEDEQVGGQSAETRNITNYNHSHALTVQYFEVLQNYQVSTWSDQLQPVLFLPFNPIEFNIELIRKYWYLLQQPLKKSAIKSRFNEFDQVVKDFNPGNGAFDASGDVRIDRIVINRTRNYSANVRVNLTNANPKVDLRISATDLDRALDFAIKGTANYLEYKILDDPTINLSRFGSADSFEIDEGITAHIKSNFKKELKKKMKWYLDKDSGKTKKKRLELDREDNELGWTNNRDNLQQDVEDGLYKILNSNEKVHINLDLQYFLEDRNGQRTVVTHNYAQSFTFKQLHDGYDKEVFDATKHIENQLNSVSDINPSNVIEDLEGHFQTRRYAYTRYLILNLELAEITDLVEHLAIDTLLHDIPLRYLVDPAPIGVVDNQLIFKLKEMPEDLPNAIGEKLDFIGSAKAKSDSKDRKFEGFGKKKRIVAKGQPKIQFALSGERFFNKMDSNIKHTNLNFSIGQRKNKNGKYPVEGMLDAYYQQGMIDQALHLSVTGEADDPEGAGLVLKVKAPQKSASSDDSIIIPFQEDTEMKLDLKPKKPLKNGINGLINDYLDELKEYANTVKEQINISKVFLPTPGVFGEAILGRSNASEYLDIRRFYNWQDSPIPNSAPMIADLNINENPAGGIDEAINPNIPVSVLNQISPQQLPAPTGMTGVLQAIQNGNMFRDMSKADQFVSALSDLATLANNSAQLAGNLSGEAGKNALNAAVELGKQVASMVNNAMGQNVGPVPETPTEQGAVKNELERMAENPTPDAPLSPTDHANARQLGAPVGGDESFPQVSEGNGSGGTGGGTGGSDGSGGTGSSGAGSGTGSGSGESGNTYEPGEKGTYSTTKLKYDTLERHYSYSEGVPSSWDFFDYLLYGFGIDKYEVKESYMTTEARDGLDDLYDRMTNGFMKSGDDLYGLHLAVFGVTDNVGETAANKTLRLNRALETFGYLSDKAYADSDFPHPERIAFFDAASSDYFVTDNSSPEEREKNRGVVIREYWAKMPEGTPDPRTVLGDWEAAKEKGEKVWKTVFANAVAGGYLGADEKKILDNLENGTITDTLYFNRLYAVKYMSGNIYANTSGKVTPEQYALDFKNYLYIAAYKHETDPEAFAGEMRDFILNVINPATGEVNKRLHLLVTSEENISTVKLADFIRDRQYNSNSIYYYISKR